MFPWGGICLLFAQGGVGRFSYCFDTCMGIKVASTTRLKCIVLSIFSIFVMCMVVGFGHVYYGRTKRLV